MFDQEDPLRRLGWMLMACYEAATEAHAVNSPSFSRVGMAGFYRNTKRAAMWIPNCPSKDVLKKNAGPSRTSGPGAFTVISYDARIQTQTAGTFKDGAVTIGRNRPTAPLGWLS
jgi:hypothetical protein